MSRRTVVSRDAAETQAIGEALGARLGPGAVVACTGELGAGKTCFLQGLARGLGVTGDVTSPTFVLARTHRGPVPLTHVDAYRLREAGSYDLADLDLEEALEDGVVVVEWGEGVVEDVSPDRLHVLLGRGGGTTAEGPEGRTARVQVHGRRWSAVQPP